MPALTVSDNDPLRTGISNHLRGYLAGKGALFLFVAILRAHLDIAAARGLHGRVQRGEGGTHYDINFVDTRDKRLQRLDGLHGFADHFVHFPVAGNNWFSHSPILFDARY